MGQRVNGYVTLLDTIKYSSTGVVPSRCKSTHSPITDQSRQTFRLLTISYLSIVLIYISLKSKAVLLFICLKTTCTPFSLNSLVIAHERGVFSNPHFAGKLRLNEVKIPALSSRLGTVKKACTDRYRYS